MLNSIFLLAIQNENLIGRFAFMGVFAILIVWLILAPASLFRDNDSASPKPIPFWKSTKNWAIAVASFEMLTYWFLG